VDEADTALFETAQDAHEDVPCRKKNQWCQGADLDRTSTLNDVDDAFLEAAQGCHYQPGDG